jgi:hypothetical protein
LVGGTGRKVMAEVPPRNAIQMSVAGVTFFR